MVCRWAPHILCSRYDKRGALNALQKRLGVAECEQRIDLRLLNVGGLSFLLEAMVVAILVN
jgi:hypothetical protein